LLVLLCLIGSCYVGWNIGANDTANCIGPTVGSGIMDFPRAVALAAIFVVVGAVFGGRGVIENVGTGIIPSKIDHKAILVGLLCAGFFVTLATIWRVPVSTAQSIIGAVTGLGLALNTHVETRELIRILGSWVICPILALLMSYVLYLTIARILTRSKHQRTLFAMSRYVMILASCYVAYSLGANNVGNSTGLIHNMGKFDVRLLALLGGVSIAVGALTFGRRVTMTVGKNITPLNVPGALAAQFSAAFGIHLFAMLRVPVSTSQAIVGAVMGVGLVKGGRAVSRRTLVQIAVGWVATPTLAGIAAFLGCRFFV